MSGYNYGSDSDFEGDGPGSGGSGLRKMLEETLAENKKLLDRLNNADRAKSVSDLLKEKELDPAIAQLIPADADAAKWLEEKAHLFVKGYERDGEKQGDRKDLDVDLQIVTPSEEDLAVQLEEQRALEAMSNAQQSGIPASVSNDLLDQLKKFEGSEEELVKFLGQNGASDSF